MPRRLPTWLSRQDRLTRAAVTAAAVGLIALGGYSVWESAATARRAGEARAALARRDYKSARALLDRCLAARPKSDEYHYLAARAARLAGDYRAADRLLARAADLGWPENAVAFERALLQAQTGQFRSVEPELRAFLRTDPPADEADLVLEVIVPVYLREYDVRPALDLLEGWVVRRPDDVRLRLWQYEGAKWMKAAGQAADALRAAHALAPDDPELRLKLGEQLLDIHQAAEAKPHFEWLLARDPDRPAVRFGLARAERELGNTDRAIGLLDGLLAGDPANPSYLSQRGYADLFAGRPQQALPWLRKAADRNPHELDLLTNLAVCLEQCGKPDEAKGWRAKAAAIDADLKEMKALTAAIAADPHDPEPWYKAGVILARNGQAAEARQWFASALRVKPDYAPARKALADLPPPRRE
jgi:predicted Zn-dependent protease